MPGIYDDDVFVEGSFSSNLPEEKRTNALEGKNEGDEFCLIFIPIREISYKEQNGWGSYLCENNDDVDCPPTFMVNGMFTDQLDLGQTYRSDGTVMIKNDFVYFRIKKITKVIPETRHGVISFMRSLDGMRFQADLIYEKFGVNSLKTIVKYPEKILDLLPGSYPEQVELWKTQIEGCKNNYGRLAELIDLGIKPSQAKQAYSKYGESIFQKIKDDPFFLVGKIKGYGFKKCDAIGKELGIEPNDVERLSIGILYVIQNLMANGSTCINKELVIANAIDELSIKMTYNEMVKAAKNKTSEFSYFYGKKEYKVPVSKIKKDLDLYSFASNQKSKASCRTKVFDITREDVEKAIGNLRLSERIVIENDMIYIRKYYDQELNIAYYIQQINRNRINIGRKVSEEMVDKYCCEHGIVLEEKQREAIVSVCSNMGGINVINGAAGCGKTFCIKIALKVLEEIYHREGKKFEKVIVAPTGKAARVAFKQTGINSYTIHRALQYNPESGFFYNSMNKLPFDCIVIDETSMLDTEIAHSLISAIEQHTNVIMLGDTNQLPSIGAGNILHDLINSKTIDVTTLNVIKRQGKDSGIVLNARNIINGEMITTQKEFQDSYVVAAHDDQDYVLKIIRYCQKVSPDGNLDQLQLLSPMKKGLTGTHYLNYIMQAQYNPFSGGIEIPKVSFEVKINEVTEKFNLCFRKGDKVINTKNDYNAQWYQRSGNSLIKIPDKAGVTNGEVGIISLISESQDQYGDVEQKIVVKFEDKYVIYINDFDNLELAYAITIHRSQGSEWENVIIPLHKSHKSMIDRNLFYTGVTRAKKINVVISDKDTISYGIKNERSVLRVTGLSEKLKEMIQTPRNISDRESSDFLDN